MTDLTKVLYQTKFYDADKQINLQIINSGKSVVFNNAEIDPNELINFGITTYPTKPILSFNGKVLTLYDEVQNLYFDRRQDLNKWQETNPTPFYNEPQIPDGNLDIELLDCLDINIQELAVSNTLYKNQQQDLAQALDYNGEFLTDKYTPSTSLLQSIIIDTTIDYEKQIYVFIQNESGQTINGITYNYGDEIQVTLIRKGIAGTEYFFYNSQPLFNDTNDHTQQEFDDIITLYNLTTTNPNPFIFGVTTELPVQYDNMPQTHWWWSGGFNGGSNISNWYNSNTGATATPPLTDTDQIEIAPDKKYADCVISNGSETTSPTLLRLAKYSTSFSQFFATGTNITRSSTRANNVIVVLYNELFLNTTWDLPSGLYTLSGRTITWNTSNKFYLALYGKTII